MLSGQIEGGKTDKKNLDRLVVSTIAISLWAIYVLLLLEKVTIHDFDQHPTRVGERQKCR